MKVGPLILRPRPVIRLRPPLTEIAQHKARAARTLEQNASLEAAFQTLSRREQQAARLDGALTRAQRRNEVARQLKALELAAQELRDTDAQLAQICVKPKTVDDLRGLVKRTLIVAPANLCFQWQRELKEKFREPFEVIRSDVGASPLLNLGSVLGVPVSVRHPPNWSRPAARLARGSQQPRAESLVGLKDPLRSQPD